MHVITATRRTDVVATIAGLVTVTLWGSAFVGIRAAGETFSPGPLALGRPGQQRDSGLRRADPPRAGAARAGPVGHRRLRGALARYLQRHAQRSRTACRRGYGGDDHQHRADLDRGPRGSLSPRGLSAPAVRWLRGGFRRLRPDRRRRGRLRTAFRSGRRPVHRGGVRLRGRRRRAETGAGARSALPGDLDRVCRGYYRVLAVRTCSRDGRCERERGRDRLDDLSRRCSDCAWLRDLGHRPSANDRGPPGLAHLPDSAGGDRARMGGPGRDAATAGGRRRRPVPGRGSHSPAARALAARRTRWSRSATFVARRAASAYATAAAGRSPPSSCR